MSGGKDFADFIATLNGHGVEYVIVGGHALAFHGRVRATKDLDVLVRPTAHNARRVIAALNEFGFQSLGLSEADIRAENVIQLGNPPNRIDLIMGIDGVDADAAWQERVMGRFLGQPAPFLSRSCLIRNKRASGRVQDVADLEALGEKPGSPRLW